MMPYSTGSAIGDGLILILVILAILWLVISLIRMLR
jgi:hypothetical protein